MGADVKFDLILEEYKEKIHLPDILNILVRMKQSDASYPPPEECSTDLDSLHTWFTENKDATRLIATAGYSVVGHILYATPHEYLTDYFDSINYVVPAGMQLAEIGKFFIDPDMREHGFGTQLFEEAFEHLETQNIVPCLAVLGTTPRAKHLYEKFGMEYKGSFEGSQGTNHVFVGRSIEGGNNNERS